jgi:xylulokinase/glycerol kinase
MSAFVTLGVFQSYEEAFAKMVEDEAKVYLPNPEDKAKYEKLRARKHDLYNALNQSGVYERFMETV